MTAASLTQTPVSGLWAAGRNTAEDIKIHYWHSTEPLISWHCDTMQDQFDKLMLCVDSSRWICVKYVIIKYDHQNESFHNVCLGWNLNRQHKQHQFFLSNTRNMWSGLRTITVYQDLKGPMSSTETVPHLPNEPPNEVTEKRNWGAKVHRTTTVVCSCSSLFI